MKIYIAGLITGVPVDECNAKFLAAEKQLREIDPETISIVNPLKLGIPVSATREEALPHCFKALRFCSAIYLLRDWVSSFGAQAELQEAMRFKLDVFYEADGDIARIEDCVKVNYSR